MLDIRSFYEADSGTWTHLLADRASKVAAIIDPVWVYDPVSGMADATFIDGVLAAAEREAYRLEWVLETHAHADHLTAADYLRRKTGARIACGAGIRDVQQTFARVFNLPGVATDGSQFDRLFAEGDTLALGSLEIRVLETPGHTGDSISYWVGNSVFVGDTLFAPGYGTARCDFPGGDAGRLFDSITRLHGLPDDTRLFLCHDYPEKGAEPVHSITVGQSRRENIHVREGASRQEFVAMRNERDAKLGLPRLILPSLQVNILAGAPPQVEDNGVSYLRTPFNCPLGALIDSTIQSERTSK
jgi:glyoxylase-like metal-dependent hydrolase (beta-lactamase superfamily II)